jgi:hypothetical protein
MPKNAADKPFPASKAQAKPCPNELAKAVFCFRRRMPFITAKLNHRRKIKAQQPAIKSRASCAAQYFVPHGERSSTATKARGNQSTRGETFKRWGVQYRRTTPKTGNQGVQFKQGIKGQIMFINRARSKEEIKLKRAFRGITHIIFF